MSTLQTAINDVLRAQLALRNATNTPSAAMSSDPAFRNRPERQMLTTALNRCTPNPFDLGRVCDAISELSLGNALSRSEIARVAALANAPL